MARNTGGMTMRFLSAVSGALALLALPAMAQTPTPLATSTLATLCSASGTEGDAAIGVGYCRGFIVGVWQYHTVISSPGGLAPIFCLPQAAPTLGEAQVAFVAWTQANPEYASIPASDGVLRWAAAAYPCPTPPPAPARARRR